MRISIMLLISFLLFSCDEYSHQSWVKLREFTFATFEGDSERILAARSALENRRGFTFNSKGEIKIKSNKFLVLGKDSVIYNKFDIAVLTSNMEMLHQVISEGNLDDYILSSNSNFKGEGGIHFALRYGSADILNVLIDKYPSIDIENDDGYLIIDYVYTRLDILELLLKRDVIRNGDPRKIQETVCYVKGSGLLESLKVFNKFGYYCSENINNVLPTKFDNTL